ncbi:LytR C-terminal domain-containing protein [Mycobacterium sp. SMC-2]|uniref:LytR C-terminal domain-containing protein n=1 Tax=Mycobacterium sp. SMC-2 TaxID=2857058 RepID=UPI0021B4611B|nr:LytR C-terminal domain-containing protein [Mycobacterium sp. SMC-2]UXA07719.1 LytR C-terminal domain-containing protein [Mycobacterium sp. SMC-2]
MKERVPDSTGLPLRAMVMVLLFLGVIFLLLGWQALGSSHNSEDDSASPVSTSTSTSPSATPTTTKPVGNRAEVQVYNISTKEGVASRTRDQLTAAGFNVTKVDNMTVPDVSTTTVYYTDADDEHATADAVGKNLGAPVEPRIPALVGEPPGVIVLVTG